MPATAAYSILLKKEKAHDDPIYCCAWTKVFTTGDPKGPSKDFIVTGGLDSIVKIWLLDNNKLHLVHSLKEHTMAVISVAVSPDGHTLASTSLDCTLIIWDLLSGNKVHRVKTGATGLWKVAFSPDGNQVVTGSHTGKLIIYGIETGTAEQVLDSRGTFALSVAWSGDGKYIACGAADGAVSTFSMSKGKLVNTLGSHSRPVRGVAFSGNSGLLISACDYGIVKTFNFPSGSELGTMRHTSAAVCVCASGDGSRIAASFGDGSVRLALANLELLHTFKEHTDTVWGVEFNSACDKLVSVSKDRSINIYECPVPPKNTAKK